MESCAITAAIQLENSSLTPQPFQKPLCQPTLRLLTSLWLAGSTSTRSLWGNETLIQKDIRTPVFTAASFTTAGYASSPVPASRRINKETLTTPFTKQTFVHY